MEINIGDLIDRLSILIHKCEKIGEGQYEEFFNYSREVLLNSPKEAIEEIIDSLRKLYIINGEIWKLESDIRLGKENKLGLEEVGRRAIKIREFNGKRIEIKNGIAKLFNQELEIKIDHASEKEN